MKMTTKNENVLKNEIQHIFDSGANEIRIFEMTKSFIEKRYKELDAAAAYAATAATAATAAAKIMKIEIGKKYRTRDGEPVRIICIDRKHLYYPVLGLALVEGEEEMRAWTGNGQYHIDLHKNQNDLVEVTRYDHLKIDDKVIVWEGLSNFQKRHFAGVSNHGRAKTFENGRTSFSNDGNTTSWSNCLSVDDFIEKYPEVAKNLGLYDSN